MFTFSVILLAAGFSRRMGRPKALLPWQATTLYSGALGAMQALGPAGGVVVLNAEVARLVPSPPAPLWAVLNPDPDTGQLASLKLALRSLLDQETSFGGAMLLIVDNPGDWDARLSAILQAAQSTPEACLVAGFQGQPGHPLWLPERLWNPVLDWQGEGGLRAALPAVGAPPRIVETGFPSVLYDLDTPQDYAALAPAPLSGHGST